MATFGIFCIFVSIINVLIDVYHVLSGERGGLFYSIMFLTCAVCLTIAGGA